MRVQAVKHGEIVPWRARLPLPLLNLMDQIGGFDFFRCEKDRVNRIALKRLALPCGLFFASRNQRHAAICDIPLGRASNFWIFRDQRKSTFQDRRC